MSGGEALVRRIWDRWNSGERDFDAELFDPEIEVHSHLARGVFRGPEGVEAWAREIDQQFEAWRVVIAELRTLDDGRILATGEIHGKGKRSGIDLDQPAAWIIEIREGRMLSLRNFIGVDGIETAEREVA